EATHTCMTIRGVRKPGSTFTTSAVRGIFKTNQSTRNEFITLIYGGKWGHARALLPSPGLRDALLLAAAVARPGHPAFFPAALPHRPRPDSVGCRGAARHGAPRTVARHGGGARAELPWLGGLVAGGGAGRTSANLSDRPRTDRGAGA